MTMYSESLRAFLKPVLPYLDDDAVTEVLINAPDDIWIERKGKLFKTDARFTEEGLLGAVRNMAQFVGRPISDERPRLDARLPDGSRIHVVLPPIARRGATMSIRKFFRDKLTIDGLLGLATMTAPMARLIEAIIHLKLNMVVAGGTGSGKTTLLNIVSSLIPDGERIVTIEDSAELQLNKSHLVSLESRPPDKNNKGGVDMGDLLHTALRLRPDRIVVGEVRGGECFHLMQAMNTGHGGSLSTVHANTPTDTLRRLESLCLMSAVELPMVAVRAQVASAINVIVCCERLLDGTRKVTSISQVLPLNERGEYRTQDLFVFTPVTRDENGNVVGYHAPTGIIPSFLAKAKAYGFDDLDERFFDPATYDLPPPPVYAVGEEVVTRWVPSLRHREHGEDDPAEIKLRWGAYERKLKEDAARTRAEPPPDAAGGVGSSARPPPPTEPGRPASAASEARTQVAPAPALKSRPLPAPPAGARKVPGAASSTGRDDDATPPPSRNPFPPDRAAASAAKTQEPLVQVSQDLIHDAANHNTAVRTYPPPPPSRAAPARPAGTAKPPAARPAREESDAAERTDVKPAPGGFRK